MNDAVDDKIIHYKQLSDYDRHRSTKNKKKINKSFGAQEVNFKNFTFVPEGYESIAYMLYFLLIPYLLGAVFLYIVVAHSRFVYFKMLNMDAYPVIWLIGYEITAIIALCWIFIFYLRYDEDEV